MRVTIVGVGAIGAVLGWLLAEAGHEVTHLVRPGRAAALAWSGVRIHYADLRAPGAAAPGAPRGAGRGDPFGGEALYRPTLAEALPADGGGDFVLAPVWPRQLASLAEYLAGRGGSAEVVFIGAWAGGGDEMLPFLPAERFLCAYPGTIGAERAGYRIRAVLAGAPRATAIGELDGRLTPRLGRLAELLGSAGLAPAPSRDIVARLAIAQVQQVAPLGALWPPDSAGSAPLDDARRARQALGALREGLEVCRARGMAPETAVPWVLLRLPLGWAARLYAALHRRPEAQVMLAGPAAHGARELAAAYEEILAAGERLGLPMPYWRAGEAAVAARLAQAGEE